MYRRLELAVGDRPTITGPDVLYCDLRDLGVRPFVQCDIAKPMPFPDGQFREIHGMHCLEHISHLDTDTVLKESCPLLAPEGFLRIDVPNMAHWCRQIVQDPNDTYAMRHIYGNQEYGLNAHLNGFTQVLLEKALRRAGLVNVHVEVVTAALAAIAFKE